MADVLQFLQGQLIQSCPYPTTDFSGRTIILTGANSGLGFDCARHLVRLNVSHLIFACRSVSKGETAKRDVLDNADNNKEVDLTVWPLDLSSYHSVCSFADRCKELSRVDGLLCNAGVHLNERSVTEGNETTVTINVISTFLLAAMLLPKLRESAKRYDINPHLSIVGSVVHAFTQTKAISQAAAEGDSIFATVNDESKSPMSDQYNLSKLLVMFCVRELAARVEESSKNAGEPFVTVNCAAPGWCKTELFRDMSKDWGKGMQLAYKYMARSSEEGSRTLVHGVSADWAGDGSAKATKTHGQYLSECQVKCASGFVRSQAGMQVQKAVWSELVQKMEDIRPGVARGL